MRILPCTSKQQGQRGLNRLRLGLPAQLVLTSAPRSCLLDDISALGARVRLDAPLAKGRQVQLRFHQLSTMATVTWAREDQCGLRFDTPLEQEDMQGFLWIVQNPAHYERVCLENAAVDWLSRKDD